MFRFRDEQSKTQGTQALSARVQVTGLTQQDPVTPDSRQIPAAPWMVLSRRPPSQVGGPDRMPRKDFPSGGNHLCQYPLWKHPHSSGELSTNKYQRRSTLQGHCSGPKPGTSPTPGPTYPVFRGYLPLALVLSTGKSLGPRALWPFPTRGRCMWVRLSCRCPPPSMATPGPGGY